MNKVYALFSTFTSDPYEPTDRILLGIFSNHDNALNYAKILCQKLINNSVPWYRNYQTESRIIPDDIMEQFNSIRKRVNDSIKNSLNMIELNKNVNSFKKEIGKLSRRDIFLVMAEFEDGDIQIYDFMYIWELDIDMELTSQMRKEVEESFFKQIN